jgi:hypothetical protein
MVATGSFVAYALPLLTPFCFGTFCRLSLLAKTTALLYLYVAFCQLCGLRVEAARTLVLAAEFSGGFVNMWL